MYQKPWALLTWVLSNSVGGKSALSVSVITEEPNLFGLGGKRGVREDSRQLWGS